MLSQYSSLPTPALLIDKGRLERNIQRVQQLADKAGVKLRPHTKTHKTPAIAKMQMAAGAHGIAVAKVSEAEIMVENGLTDVLIANEPVGKDKLERLVRLSERANISFGVDCAEHVRAAEEAFANAEKPANLMIEIEVGENRSGVVTEEQMRGLCRVIRQCDHVKAKGVFCHDGFSYKAKDQDAARQCGVDSQKKALAMARIAREEGLELTDVSVGSTTSILLGCDILPGITEIRIGTYVFMDGSQALAVGDEKMETCAATILLTVMSKPILGRVVLDGGAKALTMQRRTVGITTNGGLGTLKGEERLVLDGMFDEHSILNSEAASRMFRIGDKVEVIPNHVCPAVNLYRKAYLVEDGEVKDVLPISCSGAIE